MLFAHGFGCDQNMWRTSRREFEGDYRIVLFDHVAQGARICRAYDGGGTARSTATPRMCSRSAASWSSSDVVFVGHSVSAMIGALAAIEEPERFGSWSWSGPRRDTSTTATTSAASAAPTSTGCSSRSRATTSAGRADGAGDHGQRGSARARRGADQQLLPDRPRDRPPFARVTFLSDNRADLPRVATPSLVLQCREDVIAPVAVGEYVARATCRQPVRDARRDRALPEPQRARGDGRRHQALPDGA